MCVYCEEGDGHKEWVGYPLAMWCMVYGRESKPLEGLVCSVHIVRANNKPRDALQFYSSIRSNV